MCFGPKKVKLAEAETAGAIMAFSLSLGLVLQAVFSFLFQAIVRPLMDRRLHWLPVPVPSFSLGMDRNGLKVFSSS